VHIYRWSAQNLLTENDGQVPKLPIQFTETHDVRAGLPVEPVKNEILPIHDFIGRRNDAIESLFRNKPKPARSQYKVLY
jgi:hypothetical protein